MSPVEFGTYIKNVLPVVKLGNADPVNLLVMDASVGAIAVQEDSACIFPLEKILLNAAVPPMSVMTLG
jgi:hypothetical protein